MCPLEEGMATHSSILAWRISWAEEPTGYSPDSKSQTRLKRLSTQHTCYVWPLMYLYGSSKLLCLVHLNIFNELLTSDTLDYGQWNTRVRVTTLEF